jgi:putative transposase
MSVASGILRNYRKAVRKLHHSTVPCARNPRLTTCYGFKIKAGYLLVPIKFHQVISIPLNNHTLGVLADVKVRSITLTTHKVSISFSREIPQTRTAGYLGVDRNLDNVTIADSAGEGLRFDLSEATRIKAKYREVKSQVRRNDVRVRQRIFSKYGTKERNRVEQILHGASKKIVQEARSKQYRIVMERLTGIRRLYRQGNGHGSNYRFRLNSWSFAELQRQIHYKAQWEGIPVIYVKAGGTSAKCSICGSRMARLPEENRTLKCTDCGFTVDRDMNAARNLAARGMRFRPDGWVGEGMVEEAVKVILKLDTHQPSYESKTWQNQCFTGES